MKAVRHNAWRKGFPYFKVQYWDNVVFAWYDIQRCFGSEAEAIENASAKYRIIKVERNYREVVKCQQ
jgi:hypothetical protein